VNGPPRPGDAGVLVQVDGRVPIRWRGEVVQVGDAGSLCTQRPDRLTVWAPGVSWAYAFRLLGMCKSAEPRRSLVLTDVELSLDRVPSDTWVAVAAGDSWGPAERGLAACTCADLRSDRIFRLLLSGRVRRRPELRDLLDNHALLATPHGASLLEPWWERVIPVLFTRGLDRMMEEPLRLALEELADAARDADHALTGGFHTLDELVRGPADWEGGARRYLPLAAARSRAAPAVQRWLDSTSAWEQAPAHLAKAYRVTAATLLHQLADDPWLPGDRVAHMLRTSIAA
jgi:hypothetical protein